MLGFFGFGGGPTLRSVLGETGGVSIVEVPLEGGGGGRTFLITAGGGASPVCEASFFDGSNDFAFGGGGGRGLEACFAFIILYSDSDGSWR